MAKNIFSQSSKYNPNYATRVIRIDNIRNHPNADKLDIITVTGDNIIVARDSVKVGDLMVFCGVESALNLDFLRVNNQFRDKEANANTTETGFFEDKGRVKAIKLRNEISTGFLFPISWLNVWQPELNLNKIEDYIGIGFDEVGGQLFSKKYVVYKREPGMSGGGKNRRNNKLKQFDKLIENQFSFHYDTARVVDNMYKIAPDDVIAITSKFHGSSVIAGYVLTNKQLSWFEKLLLRLGVKIETKQYDYVYSSRGVIKNRYINKDVGSGFYATDIWTFAGEELKPFLHKGQTVYAELCGYEPGTKKFIQKDHDYFNNEGEMSIHIYRITSTNEDGVVHEWTVKQIQGWCQKMGLIIPHLELTAITPAKTRIMPVKELYYGKAKDVFPELAVEEHWHRNFADMLSKDTERFSMELNSPDCRNRVPHEGVCIRNESKGYPALKMKTKAHFLMETQNMDKGEVDIESVESEEV